MRLKKELEQEGIPTAIKLGKLGSLDIYADGTLIFSHQATGRMPALGEVLALLKVQEPK